MRTLFILYLKELTHYYKSPFGWVVISFILIMQGFCFVNALEVYKLAPSSANLFMMEFSQPLFNFFFVFTFPLITMKLFAEEERIGTREPLMTAPVHTWQVLLGKFLSCYTYYLLLWLPLLAHVYFFSLVANTEAPITQPEIFSSFLFLGVTGAFFCSIGCLSSSLTSSQIIAGIVTTAGIVFFLFIGTLTEIWGNTEAASFFRYLSFSSHLVNFIQGLVDTRTLVLYLSLALFTLTATLHVIDFRRWKN
jgi:ABC-2 type transport system permease protein